MSARQRRYIAAMSVRTLCVVLAVVVGEVWWRWLFIAGGIILPYLAVVAANEVPRIRGTALPAEVNPMRQLAP